MKTDLKVSEQTKKVTIAFVVVFFVFVLLLIGISSAFFGAQQTSQGQITLGELDFCVLASEPQNSTIMPNMFVGQSVSISNSRNENGSNYSGLCNILYKFSINIFINGTNDENLADELDFYIDNSKYIQSGSEFYYLGVLSPGQSVIIYNDVFLDAEIGNYYQGKQINFIISVDAIQAENEAYKDLWQDAPTAWKQQIEAILQ